MEHSARCVSGFLKWINPSPEERRLWRPLDGHIYIKLACLTNCDPWYCSYLPIIFGKFSLKIGMSIRRALGVCGGSFGGGVVIWNCAHLAIVFYSERMKGHERNHERVYPIGLAMWATDLSNEPIIFRFMVWVGSRLHDWVARIDYGSHRHRLSIEFKNFSSTLDWALAQRGSWSGGKVSFSSIVHVLVHLICAGRRALCFSVFVLHICFGTVVFQRNWLLVE